MNRETITLPRSVVEQAQVNSPEIPEGWRLVPEEPTEDMLNAVAWPGCAATDWEHMLAAAPQPPVVEQPPVEQEPVAWMFQHDETGRIMYVDAQQVEWGFEKGNPRWQKIYPVYLNPQPQRQPLTDEQINDHRLALAYDSEDLPDPWDFKQGVRAAERAHGIGGKV